METGTDLEKKPLSVVVVQTRSGEEDVLISFMTAICREQFIEAFVPKREKPFKRDGVWKSRIETIFPGYVFVTVEDSLPLFFSLKHVPKLSKLLCDSAYNFYSLDKKECAFILKIGNARGDHTLAMSKIAFLSDKPYKKVDKVRIVSGDLIGLEGEIEDFDIHHRIAKVRTTLFGGTVIHAGIELLLPL